MFVQEQHQAVEIYDRFLEAFNDADYDTVAKLVAPTFRDHHPGFQIDGIDSYLTALRQAHETLRLRAELEEVLLAGDRLVTRVRLSGRHVGTVFDLPATGREIAWSTTEIWRVEDGMLAERWAQDDLLGLRAQLTDDDVNMKLVQRVSDVVNERRLDDMDELFAPEFVDHNPAWTVTDLQELKGIIRAAHEGLDFTAHLDEIYPAAGGRVVIHITFTGRHVGEFFGRQPTGRDVTWTSIEVYQIQNHKVVQRWVQADTTGLMAQVGVPLPG